MGIEQQLNIGTQEGQLHIDYDFLERRNEVAKKFGVVKKEKLEEKADGWYYENMKVEHWAGIGEKSDKWQHN